MQIQWNSYWYWMLQKRKLFSKKVSKNPTKRLKSCLNEKCIWKKIIQCSISGLSSSQNKTFRRITSLGMVEMGGMAGQGQVTDFIDSGIRMCISLFILHQVHQLVQKLSSKMLNDKFQFYCYITLIEFVKSSICIVSSGQSTLRLIS